MANMPSESEEQIAFLQWFEVQYPKVRIMHIPNGGHRAMSVAKKLKREGVRAGVPDLFAPEWNLWIEMKRQKGGRLSPDQKKWIDYLKAVGHTVIIGRGADDAIQKVQYFAKAHAT